MPFTAQYANDTINSLTMNDSDWLQLKASEKGNRVLRCPECEELMVARAGIESTISAHFAHGTTLIESEIKPCSLRKTKDHLYIQEWIFRICESLGLDVRAEFKIDVGDRYRRADICLPDKKKVIEIQLSGQSDEDYFERSNDYHRQDYETLWITWKKDMRELPWAKISIRTASDEILKNKKNLMSADRFSLMTPALYFQESKYSLQGFEVDTIDRSVSLKHLIKTFAFDVAKYEVYCDICKEPHWCGEQCQKAKIQIKKIVKERKLEEDRLNRIQQWAAQLPKPEQEELPIQSEPDPVVIYNPNDDYIDYAGVRRSFNVRLHVPHLWRKPKSNNDQKES